MTQPSAEAVPDSPLLSFVLTALTAMLVPTLIDRCLAQRAAREAVSAYQARGETDWLAIGQIVGFALTVMDTLRLSMAADTAPAMTLKLRGNANAANRTAGTITDRLAKTRRTPVPVAQPTEAEPPAPTLTGQGWANGMREVAARLQAEAAIASPERRKTDELWIGVLTGVAKEIAARPDMPGAGKAALLRSTWMASDPGIPAHLFRNARPASRQ